MTVIYNEQNTYRLSDKEHRDQFVPPRGMRKTIAKSQPRQKVRAHVPDVSDTMRLSQIPDHGLDLPV